MLDTKLEKELKRLEPRARHTLHDTIVRILNERVVHAMTRRASAVVVRGP
jgi:hypothetical protein